MTDIQAYTIQGYGFVLPWNKWCSMPEFAKKMAEVFDMTNERNKACRDSILELTNCKVYRKPDGTLIIEGDEE